MYLVTCNNIHAANYAAGSEKNELAHANAAINSSEIQQPVQVMLQLVLPMPQTVL